MLDFIFEIGQENIFSIDQLKSLQKWDWKNENSLLQIILELIKIYQVFINKKKILIKKSYIKNTLFNLILLKN